MAKEVGITRLRPQTANLDRIIQHLEFAAGCWLLGDVVAKRCCWVAPARPAIPRNTTHGTAVGLPIGVVDLGSMDRQSYGSCMECLGSMSL